MRPDFTKMTIAEIRELYCEKSGASPEEAAKLSPKSAVVEKLLEYYDKPDPPKIMFENAEIDHVEVMEYADRESRRQLEANGVGIPRRGSPGWQEYVISLLTPEEYVEKDNRKYPKATGLRRLVELLLGPIVECGPSQIFPPTISERCATVCYNVVVRFDDGDRTYADIADASALNTPPEFAVHASATASSRAAGRAFRSALLLSINTAEEMNGVGLAGGQTDDIRLIDEPISAVQKVGVQSVCDRLNIDINKLLEHNGIHKPLELLMKSDGTKLMLQLNKYSATGTDKLEIPDTILVKGE